MEKTLSIEVVWWKWIASTLDKFSWPSQSCISGPLQHYDLVPKQATLPSTVNKTTWIIATDTNTTSRKGINIAFIKQQSHSPLPLLFDTHCCLPLWSMHHYKMQLVSVLLMNTIFPLSKPKFIQRIHSLKLVRIFKVRKCKQKRKENKRQSINPKFLIYFSTNIINKIFS